MKLSLIITALVLLSLLGIYLLSKGPFIGGKTYNWNLELTKPLDYEIELKNISYHKADKEIVRYTTLNSFSGWSGMAGGRVLHNKITDYLPDSVKLSWKETNTDRTYAAEFVFPKRKILDYWNENYDLQQQKWGADYPKGPLSLKLGIAPDGNLTLWFSDLDINTSGFAMEVESYRATANDISKEQQTDVDSSNSVSNVRFGTPHFYMFEAENIVAISVLSHNGESNSINLKNENGSILERINKKRGWGLVKKIMVHWFDKEGKGYKSIYEVDLNEMPIKNTSEKSRDTHIIYLLDRPNAPDAEWNKWTNKHIFQLTEVKREDI